MKNAVPPTEFVITQEMIDIARESIGADEEAGPPQPARKRQRRSNFFLGLIMLIVSLIGLDRATSSWS